MKIDRTEAVNSETRMKRYPAAIVATSVVPWDAQFELEEERFRRNVRLQLEHLTDRIYIFGTAGEGYAVNEKQFDRIAKVFWDEMQKGGGHAMLGVISLSQSTIIERIERGRDIGYRDFQISLPSWGELEDKEVDAFFTETCGRFADCRFLHYNNPRTKRLLTPVEYGHHARLHPNLVAVKTGGSGDKAVMTELVTGAPELQFFLGARAYAAIRDKHECGWLISVGSTNHALAKCFFDARGPELADLGRQIDAVHHALMTATGDGLRHMDGVYDKLIYKLHDIDFPLRLLPPYASVTGAVFERFRKLMPPAWLPGGKHQEGKL